MDLTATYCDPDGNVVETTGAPCPQPPCDSDTLEWVRVAKGWAEAALGREHFVHDVPVLPTDERDRTIIRLCDLILGVC